MKLQIGWTTKMATVREQETSENGLEKLDHYKLQHERDSFH